MRFVRRCRERGSEADTRTRELVLSMDPVERFEVTELLREELARGWIPKRPDIEAALAVVRSGRA